MIGGTNDGDQTTLEVPNSNQVSDAKDKSSRLRDRHSPHDNNLKNGHKITL